MAEIEIEPASPAIAASVAWVTLGTVNLSPNTYAVTYTVDVQRNGASLRAFNVTNSTAEATANTATLGAQTVSGGDLVVTTAGDYQFEVAGAAVATDALPSIALLSKVELSFTETTTTTPTTPTTPSVVVAAAEPSRLTTPERMGDRFSTPEQIGSFELLRLIQAASTAMWTEMGAPATDDFAYRSAAVERYGIRRGYHLRLRRRPVSSIDSITFNSIDGTAIRTLAATEYQIIDSTSGLIQFDTAHSTLAWEYHQFEPRQSQILIQSVVITYAGGWVTPAQADADSNLGISLPADLEEACKDQVLHMYRNTGHDYNVQGRTDQDGSVAYQSKSTGLLPHVRQVCARYRRPMDILG